MGKSPKSKQRKMTSVAVIGAGYWGKNLVRNFHNLGSLKLVCDKNESLLADFKSHYTDIETCLALTDVLTREDIEGVVISTPAETHFNLARESLLAGKNVLVEKPLVLHDKEAEELISLAAEKDRILMVGHLLQYHPVLRKWLLPENWAALIIFIRIGAIWERSDARKTSYGLLHPMIYP